MSKPIFSKVLPQVAECDFRLNPNNERILSDIEELIEFLHSFDTSGCFFRGQAGLWDIVSSLYRHRGNEKRHITRAMLLLIGF